MLPAIGAMHKPWHIRAIRGCRRCVCEEKPALQSDRPIPHILLTFRPQSSAATAPFFALICSVHRLAFWPYVCVPAPSHLSTSKDNPGTNWPSNRVVDAHLPSASAFEVAEFLLLLKFVCQPSSAPLNSVTHCLTFSILVQIKKESA